MTEIEKKIKMALANTVLITKANAPYKTGGLVNSIGMREYSNAAEIYTTKTVKNGNLLLPYTNGVWTHPRWNGRRNPNEGWWDKRAVQVGQYLAYTLGGIYVSNTK